MDYTTLDLPLFTKMSFKYLYIPADSNEPVAELEASKSGGLEKDLLRKHAESEFSKSGINREEQRAALASQLAEKGIDAVKIEEMMKNQVTDRTIGSVEIITLSLPTAQNNYISISLYCDGNSAFKAGGNVPNSRATAIVQACGHQNTVVMGNCFIGKAMDDERVEWERRDFIKPELDVSAPWVRVAAQANAGKDMGRYSTSGTLSAMHEAKQSKPTAGMTTPKAEPAVVQSEFSPSQLFVWTQSAEEIEVRMRLPIGVLSKHLNVTFTGTSLYVGRKNAKSCADALIETVDPCFTAMNGATPTGAKLGGAINVSESTWSIAEEREGRCLTLNLAKAGKATWKNLLA